MTNISVPILESGAVHLWDVNLDRDGFSNLLSADERERARRFHFDRDRRRFIAGRSAVRLLLGAYLQKDPSSIEFKYGPAGKPAIPHIFFNLAHSGHHGLIGLAVDHEIGVDIEQIRPLPDMDAVAQTVFAPAELARWRKLSTDKRITAFYRIWTRKEAYLKAIGEGIAHRLQKFEVAFEDNVPPVILRGAEGQWSLADASREPEVAAAVAYENPSLELKRFVHGAV